LFLLDCNGDLDGALSIYVVYCADADPVVVLGVAGAWGLVIVVVRVAGDRAAPVPVSTLEAVIAEQDAGGWCEPCSGVDSHVFPFCAVRATRFGLDSGFGFGFGLGWIS
jgi:hypothetical protein